MNKKKIVSLCLVICLLATAVVGGTLAYFTDTEEATNVFTVGKVDVQLIESYYHRQSAFMQNLPDDYTTYDAGTVLTDEQVLAGSDDAYTAYLESQTLMPGIHINKMPYVKNTGNTDAYIRIRVMIPADLDQYMDDAYLCSSALKEEFTFNRTINGTHVSGAKEDGYAVYEFTRVEALTPGEMTYWNVWNTITLDSNITNQDLEAAINDGLINKNDLTFGVKVEVDAIQAAGFTSSSDAFAAFDDQTSNSISTETYSANAVDGYVTDEVGA